MEVFLKRVPPDLTWQGLTEELDSFFRALNISDTLVHKGYKKDFATITFLHAEHGDKFLLHHGRTPSDPTVPGIARLSIARTLIDVRKSRFSAKWETLSHLRLEHDKRRERNERMRNGSYRVNTAPLVATVHEIALGKNVFAGHDERLTFCQESTFPLHATGKFARRLLMITVSGHLRIDIPYDSIKSLIADHDHKAMVLVLTEAPKFFAIVASPDAREAFDRRSSCPSWTSMAKCVAMCLVYRLSIDTADFQSMIGAIENRHSFPVSHDTLPVDSRPRPHLHEFSSCLASFEGTLANIKHGLLPFSLLFQVQSLVWGNYLHPASALEVLREMEAFAKVARESGQALPFTVQSVKNVFQRIPYMEPGVEAGGIRPREIVGTAIDEESELLHDNPFRDIEYGATIPSNQVWVMRAMITPTRIVLRGPEAESKNRILRMYPNHTHCFMRVAFCDEDGQDFGFNKKISNNAIFERWKRISREGFKVAGHRFSYLAQSHSSLRSHSAWFFTPFTDENLKRQTYETIIESLGDFRGIQIPAKHAARLGQAFSETPYSLNIFEAGINIRFIPDVKSSDGKRIFSDGVGTMSQAAMESIWGILPLKWQSTCLQIRLGGVKGMISLNTQLRGNVICIRKESMMKFPCKDLTDLGICGSASKPLRMFLNRQMIKIMEDMGVPDDWFFAMQRKALQTLRNVTASASGTSKFLQRHHIGDNMGLPQLIKRLYNMGIDYREDAFLKSAVEHVVLHELRLLKHKTRIPIEKGVTLFGVMDEFQYLEPDEIYVTFERGVEGIAEPPNGCRAIVNRCPILHPGDVQVVTMITTAPPCHPLRSLSNCVVFSQKGDRDLPSLLSGGDLDGDLYQIIWDTDAMPKGTFPPGDYPRVNPRTLGREVTRDDNIDFFFDFFKNDILGLIARRHTILADFTEEGTRHSDCLTLAGLHSTAVDYSKTGIAVDTSELPKAPTSFRPDFLAPAPPLVTYDLGQIAHIGEEEDDEDEEDGGLGGAKYKYYRSKKILGKLYRAVDEKVVWEEDVRRNVGRNPENPWPGLLIDAHDLLKEQDVHINYKDHLEEARKIRGRYEDALAGMMNQFSESHRKHLPEVEAFCGFIQPSHGISTRSQRDASIKLREEMDRVTAWVVKMIRGTDPVDDRTATTTTSRALHTLGLCMACLAVGCGESRKASGLFGEDKTTLQSFRIVAAACLLSELYALPELERKTSRGHVGGFPAGQKLTFTLAVR